MTGSKRRLLSLGVALSLASTIVVAAGTAAFAAPPAHLNVTFEGCRGSTGSFPPAGPFVCADSEYTTGNLGSGWNELDLVPYRLTTDLGTQSTATTTYTLNISADGIEAGKTGYDFISVPVVNASKSHASCSVAAGALSAKTPGIGGTDTTIYRTLTINQSKGSSCVFDYYERLALGSSQYSGSSLHSNLTQEDFSTGGIGARDISIPVKEIAPQSISKDMTATQNSDHVWNVTKSSSPASLTFDDTCGGAASRTRSIQITVSWTRLAATQGGPITIVTNVYATNPSHRQITVNATDVVYSGTTQVTALTGSATHSTPAGGVSVGANTTLLLFTHTLTVAAGTPNLNDIATASYVDTVTSIPVPGTTTATASATPTSSGTTTNQTAVITDVESISSGNGKLSYSVDSFSGASGSFGGGYVAGTSTKASVTWTSATQSGSGSVTFNKTVTADEPTATTGTLSDTATVTGSSGFTASASLSVDLTAHASVTLEIAKTIPNVLTGAETATFTFDVCAGPCTYDGSGNVTNAIAVRTITFAAGETSKSASVTGLSPGAYSVHERTAAGWAPQSDQSVTIALPSCSETVRFSNNFGPASARVRKVTTPAGSESGWQFTLSGPGTPPGGETVTTTDTGFVTFLTALEQGSYTITETARPGFIFGSASAECSFSVDYPADADRVFSCSYTNVQQGTVTVRKTVSGQTPPAGSTFSFELRTGASVNALGTVVASTTTDASGNANFGGATFDPGPYQFCETAVMPGWMTSLTSMAGWFVPNSAVDPQADNSTICVPFTLSAGEDRVFTVDNTPPPGGMPHTIGFWKNWSSCSGGKQAPVLDQTLASAGGILIGDLLVNNCIKGVRILNKSTVDTGAKMAGDAAYGLAAQLLAARLNVQAQAGTCAALTTALSSAQTLLAGIHFTGVGDYLGSKVKGALAVVRSQALTLAGTLDSYNNGTLC